MWICSSGEWAQNGSLIFIRLDGDWFSRSLVCLAAVNLANMIIARAKPLLAKFQVDHEKKSTKP